MRLLVGLLCATALIGNAVQAQEVPLEGTLPPVEVRPPEATDTSGDDSNESEILGSFDLSDQLFQDAFPSLSDQLIGGSVLDPGGLNSILRSEQSLFEMPQLGTIIDRDTLEERMSNNMFRALQNEVGITLQQTGNGQLSPFIRGLTGQQVLILIDGVRLNNSVLRAGPNQYAATIDPGMIDRIEVVRGAQSVLWGSDALGGRDQYRDTRSRSAPR